MTMKNGFKRVIVAVVIMIGSTSAYLRADNVTGVSGVDAQKLGKLVRPGNILIWNCPTCKGVVVMRVNSVEVGRDGNQPEFAVRIKRDILIQSLQTYEMLGNTSCAKPDDPKEYEEYEPEVDWTVDLTYTYFQKDKSETWTTLGSIVGIKYNPVLSIKLSRAVIEKINSCIAEIEKRKQAGIE
jgi:hypothetical protein